MSSCTFLGHGDCFGLHTEELCEAIEALISKGIDTFYVGNQGGFDRMVHSSLKQLQEKYPHIHRYVVLAYLPAKGQELGEPVYTLYPEGLELVPPRFAIEHRNKWMINTSAYCICYVNHAWGGAYKFAKLAKRRGLQVINLGSADL